MRGNRFSSGAGRVTLNALFTALAFISLFFSAILPTGQLGLVAAAGLFPAASVISGGGLPAGFLCYGAVGILGIFLLPSKGSALLYLMFFGLYPLLKHLIERLDRLPLEWVCKLLTCNVALTLFWFFMRALVLAQVPDALAAPWVFYLAGTAAFVAYDLGLSGILAFYTKRIHNAIFR